MLYWLTSAASLVAVWLNIRKHRACFAIWAVTNAAWAYADFRHGLPAQAVLQLCYFALSLYGLSNWRERQSQTGV
jgi:nicotinamide riboside transporter PnuC